MSPAAARVLRRAAALAILVGLAALVAVVVWRPLDDRFATYNQSIAQSERLLEAFRRRAGERTSVEATLAGLRARQAAGTGLIVADTAQLAAARIQEMITRAIETSNGTARSVSVLPGKSTGALRRVVLRVTLEASLAALRRILHRIEGQTPYLLVEKISITARNPGRPRRGATGPGRLRITLEIAGHMNAAPT